MQGYGMWAGLLMGILMMSAGCRQAATDQSAPVDRWDATSKAAWFEERLAVTVKVLRPAKSPDRVVYEACFINRRKWMPDGLFPGWAVSMRSDEVAYRHELRLGQWWEPTVPMGRGEFRGRLQVLSPSGFYLEGAYWSPDDRQLPALDWKNTFTPALGIEVPLVVVTADGIQY